MVSLTGFNLNVLCKAVTLILWFPVTKQGCCQGWRLVVILVLRLLNTVITQVVIISAVCSLLVWWLYPHTSGWSHCMVSLNSSQLEKKLFVFSESLINIMQMYNVMTHPLLFSMDLLDEYAVFSVSAFSLNICIASLVASFSHACWCQNINVSIKLDILWYDIRIYPGIVSDDTNPYCPQRRHQHKKTQNAGLCIGLGSNTQYLLR